MGVFGSVWECFGVCRSVWKCLGALHISRAAMVRFAEKLRGWVLHRRSPTRFTGTPEATSHSAFSFHLIYLFILLAVQHFRCSSRRQHSPPQRPIGPVPRACVVRHGATGLRCQVSMRHFPFVSDGSNFSRTTFGLADRDEVR